MFCGFGMLDDFGEPDGSPQGDALRLSPAASAAAAASPVCKRNVIVHAPADAALLAVVCGSPSSVVHSWAFSSFAANQLPVLSLFRLPLRWPSLSRAGGDSELTPPRAPPRQGEGGADQIRHPFAHGGGGPCGGGCIARRRTSWRGRTARPRPRRWRCEAEQQREASHGGRIRHVLAA
jgi:hypothetical protein